MPKIIKGKARVIGAELFINGGFDVWQNGLSFTDPDNTYTADMWVSDTVSTGGNGTITRETFALGQTDVPGNPKFFLQHDQTTAVTVAYTLLEQRIESVLRGSGKTVHINFSAKVSSGTKTLQARFLQNFGTTGSPSADVATASQAIALTTTDQEFSLDFTVASISGKTLGTDGNDFLAFQLREEAGFSTYTLQIAQMQAGVNIGNFEQLPQSEILEKCQRHFEKTYDQDDAPGTVETKGSIIEFATRNNAGNTTGMEYKVEKRASPTVTIFSPVTGDSGKLDNSGTERVAVAAEIGTGGFRNIVITSGSAASSAIWHYTADARL